MANKYGLEIRKKTNIEVDGEIVCDEMFTIWRNGEEECEWDFGVRLNKAQAIRSQEYNSGTESMGAVEELTAGYYIVELDRFGDIYYAMEDEEGLIEALLTHYSGVLEGYVVDECTDERELWGN